MTATTTTVPAEHTCHGARFVGTPAARATAECPACSPAPVSAPPARLPRRRVTSVYSLRIALHNDDPQVLLDLLASITEEQGALVTDTHHAEQDGTRYVSLSFRIPTSDTAADNLARVLLFNTKTSDREHYLHTGLCSHRRLVAFGPA